MDKWRAMAKWKRWTIIGVAAFFIIGIIGSATEEDTKNVETSASQTTVATVTTTAATVALTAAPTTARPTTTPPPPTTTGPKTTFGDGTYRVGADIAPGTYRSTGSGSCYWERQSSFGGGFESIIANEFARGQAVVTIQASDAGFKSQGCGTWTAA